MVYQTQQRQDVSEGKRIQSEVENTTKMISIIKKNLSSQKAVEFQTAIVNAKNLTEKKEHILVTMDLQIQEK